ncbi:MAG: DUF1573 domain-containing protein [Syntrophobacteraceae bacterium]|nr:DUF1573 domain-containing protein [Syntrophobacteraceae bacterium]
MHRSLIRMFVIATLCMGLGSAPDPACAARSSPADSASSSGTNGNPSIQISETVFDFGEVVEGAMVEHEFAVKNTGKGTLEIDQVRPG